MYFQKFKTHLEKTLNSEQKEVLKYLVLATKIIDKIFVRQITRDNFGYLKNLDKNKILNLNKKNPDILSHYTIIKKKNKKVFTIRYEDIYKKELNKITKYLILAANKCQDKQFKKFLYQRCKDLLNGTYKEGEKNWIQMKTNYPINLAIGPLLTYHDKFFGVKTFYSSCVYIRNLKKEKFYEKITKKIKKDFPKLVFINSEITPKKEIIEIGDIYAYGGEIAKMKAVAWSRPSSSTDCREIINKYGSKKLLFENAIKLRFDSYGFKIYEKIFNKKINKTKLLFFSLLGVYLHELGHAYAIYKNTQERLKNYFWTFEELKSDLFSLCISHKLIDYKFIDENQYQLLIEGFFTDILSQHELSKKIPERKGHAFSAKYLFYKFINDKILIYSLNHFKISFEALKKFLPLYLKEIQLVLATYNYNQAKNFVERTISKSRVENIL